MSAPPLVDARCPFSLANAAKHLSSLLCSISSCGRSSWICTPFQFSLSFDLCMLRKISCFQNGDTNLTRMFLDRLLFPAVTAPSLLAVSMHSGFSLTPISSNKAVTCTLGCTSFFFFLETIDDDISLSSVLFNLLFSPFKFARDFFITCLRFP